MAPSVLPGDRLYVDRAAYRDRHPAGGDLVVVLDPEDPRRWLLKRVALEPIVPAGSVYVLGDNRPLSRDSRAFGPVPVGSVVGLVWFRYAPSERRGSLTTTFK